MTDKYIFVSVPIALSKTLHPAFEVCYPQVSAPDSPIAVASHPAHGIVDLLRQVIEPNGEIAATWKNPPNATVYEFKHVELMDGEAMSLYINGTIKHTCILGLFTVGYGMEMIARDILENEVHK